MNIGYACLALGVPDTLFRSIRMNNADDERLSALIDINLNSLQNIIEYNNSNGIKLFRICSEIIPFGSSPVNKLEWQNLYRDKFYEIGAKLKEYGIRVSMHPGQYTVINSPDQDVFKRAVDDLIYHNRVLDSLNGDSENKIIAHTGGIYKDKAKAMRTFIDNYHDLDDSIKSRLVLENDDRYYNIGDVMEISYRTGMPVVFDALHNINNPYDNSDDNYWISLAAGTWNTKDGRQKIHYSEQNPSGRKGCHSATINPEQFAAFYRTLTADVDIMLEVKDKNISALKCINTVTNDRDIIRLDKEWERYRYKIYEKSPEIYSQIDRLLNERSCYCVREFYSLIDAALKIKTEKDNLINAAIKAWELLADRVEIEDKIKFQRAICNYSSGGNSVYIKNLLYKLAVKFNQERLLDSYYFVL